MYGEERRQLIGAHARQEGRVDVVELASEFDVTPETIRRDLSDLEQRGVLRRVHGGAISMERLRSEPAVAERAALMADEKLRIAKAASSYIPAEGTVLLDAGTTTGTLASLLPTDRQLTIVTNSASIAVALSSRPNLELLLVGGRVRGRTLASVDHWALQMLAELSVDVTFVAANGVTAERGLSTPDPAEAAVKRELVRCGRRVILLADHTKVGQDHFVRFADLGEIDVMVTDDGLDRDAHSQLSATGMEVVLA